MPSTITKTISNFEKEILLNELHQDHTWDFHSPGNTGNLVDGRTVYVRFVGSAQTENLRCKYNLDHKFTNTLNLLTSWFPGHNFGKIYWHRLLPGDKILPHNDSFMGYVKSNKLYGRYQIYLDVPEGLIIKVDNDVTIKNSDWENKLINFDYTLIHSYENLSASAVYLFVFDILHKGIDIKMVSNEF